VTAVNLDAKVMAVQQQEAGTLLILLNQKAHWQSVLSPARKVRRMLSENRN